jgi:ERCC4-related helicase
MYGKDRIFDEIELDIEMGVSFYHAENTQKSRYHLENAIDKLPPLNKSGDPQRTSKLLMVLENYLRLVYSSELIEASGVRSLSKYVKLLKEKGNPLVMEYEEKNRKLNDKIMEIAFPPQTSSYNM